MHFTFEPFCKPSIAIDTLYKHLYTGYIISKLKKMFGPLTEDSWKYSTASVDLRAADTSLVNDITVGLLEICIVDFMVSNDTILYYLITISINAIWPIDQYGFGKSSSF